MKRSLLFVTLIVLLVIVAFVTTPVSLDNNENLNQIEPVETQTEETTESTYLITTIDTSMWKSVQLHQNISVQIPNEWTAGSDGIYNHDHLKVTGIRDPNFPNNSFKCVFYEDESLRSKLSIENEKTLNSALKVSYITAKWNEDNQDSLRKLGEKVSIYAFNNSSAEKFVECNVFKGEMTAEDKNILENVILTIK